MNLTKYKISSWKQSVSSLPNKPMITAKDLKAAFDSNSNEAKTAINSIIDVLTSTNGASNVGVSKIDGMISKNIQDACQELYDNISKIDPYLGNPVAISQGGTNAKTPQEALYTLGCSVRPNLLDNWYFVGGGIDGKLPINQRGLSKYLSMYNNKYGIDRWFGLTMWGSVEASQTLELDGLVVASTPLQSYPDAWGGIWQKIDDLQDYIGQTATLSIYATDIETADASQVQSPNLVACNESTGFLHYTPIKNNTVTSMSFEITEKIEMVGVQVYSGTTHSNSLKIKAIKLEIGDNQTLARQLQDGSWLFLEKPDYTTELLKSQRYYQLYSDQELRPIKAIDCRPQMRIDPTQTTIMIGDVNYYVNDAQL